MRFDTFVDLDKRFEGCKKTSRLTGAGFSPYPVPEKPGMVPTPFCQKGVSDLMRAFGTG
jgi:hypothetical protein